MGSKNLFMVATALLISGVPWDTAKATPPPEDPCVHVISLGTGASFVVSRACPGQEFLDMETTLLKKGGLTNTKITRYTSDDQYNAECLDAVCNVFKVLGSTADKPFDLKIGDGSPMRPQIFSPEPFDEYKKAHPEKFAGKEKFVVVHRIPLNVWQGSEPGSFSVEELRSERNLIAIPAGESPDFGKAGKRGNTPKYVEIIEKRGQRWADLFASKQRKASKTEILELAKEMDSQIQ